MFRLTRALIGAESLTVPIFRVSQGSASGFVISVALRSLTGEVSSFSLGQPTGVGRFFWFPLPLSVDDQTAMADFVEIKSPSELSAGLYWEYLGIEAASALAAMAGGSDISVASFRVATREALPVGYPVDWSYLFDLSGKVAVSVIAVECLGQGFSPAAAPENPVAGEWILDGNNLLVQGSEVSQLQESLTLTSTFTVSAAPDSYWVEFACPWLVNVVIEQISSFGQVFTPAENPWHPGPGEYIASGTRLFIFTAQPVFTTFTAPPAAAPAGQFLGEVAL